MKVIEGNSRLYRHKHLLREDVLRERASDSANAEIPSSTLVLSDHCQRPVELSNFILVHSKFTYLAHIQKL